MYKNIGRKLKLFAKIVAIAGAIFFILSGIAVISLAEGDAEDLTDGIFMLVLGPVGSFFYALLIYGFGELLDTNQKMYGLMLRVADDGTLKGPVQQGTWTCGACWNINPKNSAECAKCGAPRK